MTAREKIEDKLAQLKARQEEQKKKQKTQNEDPDYDDDPFNLKKGEKQLVKKRSRSRSIEKDK